MKHLVVFLALFTTLTNHAQLASNDSIVNLSDVTIIGKKSKTLPGAGEVISPKKIAKLNQPDINKVLRTVPGVNVRDEEGFGLRPNIGLRGTPVNRSSKITIMEDGILMSPAAYADPAAYYFPTFARMESLEVLKGSSQIKFGPYTIGGVINLISTPFTDKFKGFALASYGSFDTNQQRLWIADKVNQVSYVFEANRFASYGFKELDNGGNTGFDRRDFMGKIGWQNKAESKIKQSFSLKFLNMTEDSNETYLGLTFADFQNNPYRRYAATERDNLDMTHQHVIFNHTIQPLKDLQISNTAYYTKTYRDWARVNSVGGQSVTNIIRDPQTHAIPYQIMTGQADGAIVFQSAARTFVNKGIQTNIKYHFHTGEVKHDIQVGLRYHEDDADRLATRSNFNMTGGRMVMTGASFVGNQENQIRNAFAFASYLQYDLNYKKLTFSPGLRFENINLRLDNYGNNDYARLGTNLIQSRNHLEAFLPGVGMNYQLTDKMNAFGGVHKGFSPPGMPRANSEEQARVEESINYELGYRYKTYGINAQVVGFYNDYSNILGSDTMAGGGLGTGDMFNAGRATIKGIEVGIDYDIVSAYNNQANYRLPLSLAYTYTDAKFKETFINGGGDWGSGEIKSNDLIPFITPHLFTATFGFENDKFNTTLISRFVGNTRTSPGQNDAIVPNYNNTYDEVNTIAKYWAFDWSANYKLTEKLTIFSMVNNVFNNSYIVANLPQGYRPGMPFAANFGLKFEF